MELMLNLAWAACSLGLILLWLRLGGDRSQRKTQMLALAMVVLLLLPVISLSDDIIAMQGLMETDSAPRRAHHSGSGHPLLTPASIALPEQVLSALFELPCVAIPGQHLRLSPPRPILDRSLDRRPPPVA